jgi:hypothetical protein
MTTTLSWLAFMRLYVKLRYHERKLRRMRGRTAGRREVEKKPK